MLPRTHFREFHNVATLFHTLSAGGAKSAALKNREAMK
jgi:hypothetical protein